MKVELAHDCLVRLQVGERVQVSFLTISVTKKKKEDWRLEQERIICYWNAEWKLGKKIGCPLWHPVSERALSNNKLGLERVENPVCPLLGVLFSRKKRILSLDKACIVCLIHSCRTFFSFVSVFVSFGCWHWHAGRTKGGERWEWERDWKREARERKRI